MEDIPLNNPYLNYQVIHDPWMFFGRGDLLSRIYSVIGTSGSISLVGPPRIGKGSLLYCLRFQELQQRYGKTYAKNLSRCLFVFVDMRTYAHRNWSSFFKALNREIINQCRDIINLDAMPTEGSEEFIAILDEISDRDYRLVLALDSFEKLKENEQLADPLPMFLRSESARVSYVIASTLPLHEIFPKEPLSSPFYNIFLYREKVGMLAPDDARALAVEPTKDAGLSFSEEERDWILKQAGRHPFFLQRICQILFDIKALAPEVPIDLEQAQALAYQALFPHFKALWHGMDEEQQEKLRYELHKEEAQEFYESALFRRFVEELSGGGITIQIQDIKDALKKLSDTSLLGKSHLRHLQIVRCRLNSYAQPSQSEVGLIVRTVLFEAWEHLKGQGTRTDIAPEWEAFNILYYCYFKHHTPNNALGARLGMSTRTYYRKKEDAIKKLLGILQEMEGTTRH